MSDIELRQLRYFIAVAEEKHFGRAAARLRIAQPGLSQQIKTLERTLGVPLFIRDSRSVELTEAGEAFLRHARLVIELAGRAVESAHLVQRGKQGVLKVGVSVCGIHALPRELLRQFQARHPDIALEIHPGLVPQNIDALMRRTVDVAIVFPPFESKDAPRYLSLGMIEIMVALPAGHRLAELDRIPRRELLRERFLDWPRSANPPLIDHLHRSLFGEEPHPRLVAVADVMESNRLLLVAQGVGITLSFFPSLAELEIPSIVFRPLEAPAFLECGVAWLDGSASPFVEWFVNLARQLSESPPVPESAVLDPE